ncbi:MAG: hypothetical protein ACRCS0_09065 [Albidovulum sp.]
MRLSISTFSTIFKTMPRYTPVSNRLFADGQELDPDTAIIISGLPRFIWDDIGVTDLMDQDEPMDKHLNA